MCRCVPKNISLYFNLILNIITYNLLKKIQYTKIMIKAMQLMDTAGSGVNILLKFPSTQSSFLPYFHF